MSLENIVKGYDKYGPFIVDKYQTKYIIPIESLCTSIDIHTPDLQREANIEVINDIIEYQLNTYNNTKSFSFLGELTIIIQDNKYYIIDGQHRYEAMKKIYNKCPFYLVSINIIKPDSYLTIEKAFELLNKSKPVPDYIIQNTTDTLKKAKLDHFKKLFINKYKVYISKSNNPRKPNVNIDTLLNKINNSNLINNNNMNNANDIFEYMDYVNIIYWKQLDTKYNIKCIEKVDKLSEKHVLYICNDIEDDIWLNNTDWVDEFIEHRNKIYDTTTNKRKKISIKERKIVWEKDFKDNEKGICKVCNKVEINTNTFQCGHIISHKSHKNGGETSFENLKPICVQCNNKMSSMNLYEYMKQIY
uniref:HNH domain-containing protein n=1 Tax=viral metagenome TaxID=1070528 RepID=A0A6C0I566_9ZZZZ